MKKIWIALLLAFALTGCKVQQEIKLDTIVDIPLHPTKATEAEIAPSEPEASAAVETVPTEVPSEATKNDTAGSGGKTSNGQKPSKNSGSVKNNTTSEVQPATEAPPEVSAEAPTEIPTEPPTEAPTQPPAYDPSGYAPGSLDRSIADAVNAQRQAAGLAPLTLDSRLCAIASVRAREASVNWSHTRPDGSGSLTVLRQYGYAYGAAGENLYFGAGGAESIVSKWMSSDAHRNQVLMAEAAVIGVGSYTAADGLTYVAALFVG